MEEKMNAAERIIRRFGGQSALAALLGKRQSTIEHWARTGRVPAQWQMPLMSLGRQRGVILEAKDFVELKPNPIQAAEGRLGILLVGLGAVASTFISGVEHARRGSGRPVGSLTQMGTIRVGKRTENRSPLIREFVPLANLDDIAFGAWDPFPDNAYEAAVKCGVLDRHEHIQPIADFLQSINTLPAASAPSSLNRLNAPNGIAYIPALAKLAIDQCVPICGKHFKTGQPLIKTVLAPMLKARMLGLNGWYSTNILGNRDGEVLDDPESFKTKEESKLGVLEHILEPDRYPELYGDIFHKVRINYYPPRGDNKEGWDNIDIFGWMHYPMQIKVDFLCRDSILAAPLALDLALFSDLASRSGMGGIQEWLSFYYKSPQVAPGLYPEHDLFIQLTKLKNTLRRLRAEALITHPGLAYYD